MPSFNDVEINQYNSRNIKRDMKIINVKHKMTHLIQVMCSNIEYNSKKIYSVLLTGHSQKVQIQPPAISKSLGLYV